MLIIPFLILLLFFGLLVTITLKVKVGLAERLSLSYLLGIGLFTFFVFAFDLLFNIDYSIYNTFSLLLSLCAILFAIKRKDTVTFFKEIKFEKKKPKMISVVFWGIILTLFIYTFIINIYWPVFDWDALALYDFRARVFMVDRNLIHAFLNNNYFLGYPLLTSLAHLFVYQMGLQSPKFIYSLFYLSFILIFYFSLKRNVSEKKTMFFTSVLALTPEIFAHATMSYTNLPYIIFLCSGSFYLFEWIVDKKFSWLFLSALLTGLSVWVRFSEPFWIIPLIVVFLVSLRYKKLSNTIYYLIFVLVFWVSWDRFTIFINKTTQPVLSDTTINNIPIIVMTILERTVVVVGHLYKYLFSSWGLISLLFALIVFLAMTNYSKKLFVIRITLSFFVILFVGTWIFSITYPGWQDIPDSVRRMGMFFLPLMIYSIAIYTEKHLKN